MNLHETHQAQERALLKDLSFSREQEIRITTMNIKTPACVRMDGVPYTQEQISGKNMNNFENPGLYIRVNIENLIDAIVVAPQATEWFEFLIKRIIDMSKLNIVVKKSELEIINA